MENIQDYKDAVFITGIATADGENSKSWDVYAVPSKGNVYLVSPEDGSIIDSISVINLPFKYN